MQTYTGELRQAAKRLLAERRVDAVIGFRKGTVPFMNEPFLATTPEQADQLVWDGNCGINLANYLPEMTGNIAIAAKGCDSRSIMIHLQENQVRREQLYILGIACRGMIDKRKIRNFLNGREVLPRRRYREQCAGIRPWFRENVGASRFSPAKLRHLHAQKPCRL